MPRIPYGELDVQTRALIEAVNGHWIERGMQIAIGFWVASLIPVIIFWFVIGGLVASRLGH